MFWSYNIVKLEDGYGLYEVYYDDDWSKPFMRTEDCMAWGETPEEVQTVLRMMFTDSLKNPVLNDEDIREENDSYN
ncbi:MAG: hypothetical protein WC554_08515 [Clostridia bacterium]